MTLLKTAILFLMTGLALTLSGVVVGFIRRDIPQWMTYGAFGMLLLGSILILIWKLNGGVC